MARTAALCGILMVVFTVAYAADEFVDSSSSEQYLVKPSARSEIRVFEHDNYSGGMQIHYRSVEELRDSDFQDKISSVQVIGGIWIMYEHPHWDGRQWVVFPGVYPSPSHWDGSSDCVSGLRLVCEA